MLTRSRLFKIVEDIEGKTYEKESDTFTKVFDDFIASLSCELKVSRDTDFSSLVYSLMKELNNEDLNNLYCVLSNYGYRELVGIKFAIQDIGLNRISGHSDRRVIKNALKVKTVKGINTRDDGFTLYSSLGNFNVIYPSEYYDSTKLSNYINVSQLLGRCHYNTEFLSKLFNNGTSYSITSLCSGAFDSKYFHSYFYDSENDKVCDLCLNAVLDKKDYDRLVDSREISIIPNDRVEEEYRKVLGKTYKCKDVCELLLIAIYKIYKERKKDSFSLLKKNAK